VDRTEISAEEQSSVSVLAIECPGAMSPDELLGRVLAENEADFMSLGMLGHYVRCFARVEGEDLRRGVLLTLERLLNEELMSVGAVVHRRFVPWTCTPAEAVALITRLWPTNRTMDYDALASLCWLANTPKGSHQAAYLSELGRHPPEHRGKRSGKP